MRPEDLREFLPYQRATVALKARDLDDAEGAKRPFPSPGTVSGVVRHRTGVERHRFRAASESSGHKSRARGGRNCRSQRERLLRGRAPASLRDAILPPPLNRAALHRPQGPSPSAWVSR
ncbi:DUF664 domain-containing protein [Lacisediminihabitans sp. H27-G8]|uniref:mycothiol transferase n=1 Tax=Lacisediminihabitans sp. H27-G8 TaxID=3111909 RepID=UPI0038FBFE98